MEAPRNWQARILEPQRSVAERPRPFGNEFDGQQELRSRHRAGTSERHQCGRVPQCQYGLRQNAGVAGQGQLQLNKPCCKSRNDSQRIIQLAALLLGAAINRARGSRDSAFVRSDLESARQYAQQQRAIGTTEHSWQPELGCRHAAAHVSADDRRKSRQQRTIFLGAPGLAHIYASAVERPLERDQPDKSRRVHTAEQRASKRSHEPERRTTLFTAVTRVSTSGFGSRQFSAEPAAAAISASGGSAALPATRVSVAWRWLPRFGWPAADVGIARRLSWLG
jgi:hypothetical protein